MAGCYRTFFHRGLGEAVKALNDTDYPHDPSCIGVRLVAADIPAELSLANTAGRDYLIRSAAHSLAALIAFGLVCKASSWGLPTELAGEPAHPTWALEADENGSKSVA
ncbi:hypothetical protein CH63R_14499 [Colletotrichum higginsianum IMI 349063]|nr:hypothetical protein CH63R_14499 [Colletotrichum higginsianum IMI 349063]OBR02198.1 hypothetical protein CH63R_14499 [Colletotrichum higginsianum IMI 349063]